MLARLAESAEVYQVRVYLYCLMSNHIHLLVETPLGNLDRFMGSLLTGYTVYFNRRHNRHGHLFQGRYGAQVVEGDAYLLKLSRYIHLNPVQGKRWRDCPIPERVEELRSYPWSSYRTYTGLDKCPDWLITQPVILMMQNLGRPSTARAYARFVESGLTHTDEEFVQLMKSNPVAIGPEDFVTGIKRRYQAGMSRVKREDISLRAMKQWKTPESVGKAVEEVLGTRDAHLARGKQNAAARGFFAWALRRYAGLTQREIAPYLQITTGAGVCLAIRRATSAPSFVRWQRKLALIFKG